jgi:hypothetical protein
VFKEIRSKKVFVIARPEIEEYWCESKGTGAVNSLPMRAIFISDQIYL